MNEESRTDSELVAASLEGKRAAFGQLYDRHARRVRLLALGATWDPSAIDDLTQETFLRAYRQLGTLRDGSKFAAWLVGIARQIVREQSRKRRFEGLAAGCEPVAEVEPSTADLLELVGRLPEEERLAIGLFFLQERDIGRTAAELNRSRSGTYALLAKAVARLAKWWHADEPEEAKR